LNPRGPDRQPDGRAGPSVLLAGILLIIAAQALAPVAAPLFDSLIVLSPYRYLNPVGSETGAPTSGTATESLAAGASPGFNAATSELPPQAQLIAPPGTFQLASGTTSVTVRISPVAPPAPATLGPILGNVYDYAVTDQNNVALLPTSGTLVTLVLRAPDANDEAIGVQYSGGSWKQVPSSPSGTPGFFIVTTATFGDFALIASTGSGIGPLQVVLFVVPIIAVAAIVGFVLIRRRRRPVSLPAPSGRRRPPGATSNRRKRKRR
jgi:hypothetical protein